MMSSGSMTGGDSMMSGAAPMMEMSAAPTPAPEPAPTPAEDQAATPADANPAPVEQVIEPLKLNFPMASTRIPLGEVRMIPVQRVGGKLNERLEQTAQVEGGDSVEILRQPLFLADYDIGFMRVRANRPGQVNLKVGEATLKLEVTKESSPTREMLEKPVITAPANGSAVKGEFAVGLELFADPTQNLGGKTWALRLRLPDGKLLEPVEELGLVDGPVRRAMFLVNSDALPDGRVDLTPVAVNAEDKREVIGDRVEVRPLAADAEVIAAGECEEVDETWERPKDWKEFPMVTVDAHASGQLMVRMPGKRPNWGIPLKLKEDAQYQLFARVKGDLAGGAYPTLTVDTSKAGNNKATVRVVSSSWHRLPIGPPFRMKKEEEAVGISFINDFGFQNRANRDAYIDTYELVKVKYREAPETDEPRKYTAEEIAAIPPTATYFEPSAEDAPIRVTFMNAVNGLVVKGETELQGIVWRNNKSNNEKEDKKRQARVTLYLNGEAVDTKRSDEPTFTLPSWRLRKGENSVRLHAWQNSRREAWSETALISRDLGPDEIAKPQEIEKAAYWAWRDNGWKRLEGEDKPGDADVNILYSNGDAQLEFPQDLAGKVNLVVRLRGDQFEGAPEAIVKLGDKELGKYSVPAEWTDYRIENVEIPKEGNRHLKITFTNDKAGADVATQDRNLHVGGVTVLDKTLEPDKTAPIVKVLYPKAGQELSQVDTVILQVFDDRAIENMDLELDGKSLGYWTGTGQKPGYVVLPLTLRTFAPGEHKLKATLRDKAGNSANSGEIKVRLAEDNSLAARLKRPYDRAERMLRRFAFGPEPAQLAEILLGGEEAWLAGKLAHTRGLSADEYRANQIAYIRLPKMDEYHVANRALQFAIATDNPVEARFSFWIQNHFCTWLGKTGTREKWDENLAFQQLGTAPFSDLLYTSATSAAMMVFLDQRTSYAGKINENYAREIMELHTVGVKGGYTQKDVTELAGMLTGWAAHKEGILSSGTGEGSYIFRYSPYLNDGSPREIYGLSLPLAKPEARFDRVRQYLEMLACRPQTARYFAEKIAAHYYGPGAPEAVIHRLRDVYLTSGGDSGEMLMALYKSPEFWSDALPQKVAQPLDYGIGLERVNGGTNNHALHEMMQKAGRALFDRSTPDGYPEEDDEYADSNFMLQKWRFAKSLEWELTRDIPWSYWQPDALKDEAGQRRLLDMIAARVTGNSLSPRSEEAAMQVLNSDIPDARQKVNQVAVLIAQLPETQVR